MKNFFCTDACEIAKLKKSIADLQIENEALRVGSREARERQNCLEQYAKRVADEKRDFQRRYELLELVLKQLTINVKLPAKT